MEHHYNEAEAKGFFLRLIDGSMMVGLFFSIIMLLLMQACYIHCIRKVKNAQAELEAKFMGPEAITHAPGQPSYVRSGQIQHGANHLM